MPKWLQPHSHHGMLLLFHDVLALYVAVGVVHKVRLGYWVPQIDFSLLSIIAVTVVSLYVMNVYVIDRRMTGTKVILRTFVGVVLGGTIVASFIYLTKSTTATTVFWRGNLPLSMLIFALWAIVVRYAVTSVWRRFVREPRWLVIGSGPRAELLRKEQAATSLSESLDFLSVKSEDLASLRLEYDRDDIRVSNPPRDIYSGRISGVVLADDQVLPETFVTQLMGIRLKGVPILDLPDYYEQKLLRVPVLQLQDGWFALTQGFSLIHHDIEMKIKRIIDVVLAVISLCLLSPLLVAIAISVMLSSHGPIFYSQTRCGHRGRDFRLHKFRTMVKDAEEQGVPRWAEPDDPRITRVGKILRALRADELPQLWNVLIGDMSFIGPRPERPDFVQQLENEIPYYDLRHLVKPGITGWAQVMYPYGASIGDARRKLEYDLYYIKNYSLALDLYIFIRTVRVVCSAMGR